MTYLIDTDWLIDYLLGVPPAQTLLASLLPDGLAISIITYSEVYEGILRSPDIQAGARGLRAFLRGAAVLPVTKTVARRNAQVRAHLRGQGRSVRQRAFDLLIAATALTYGLTVVTRNRQDYNDVPGISLY
jgi:predicted nucleic acid-binding protein